MYQYFIPLYGSYTFHSIAWLYHVLLMQMDVWVVSIFWLMLPWTFMCKFLFEHLFPIPLDIYLLRNSQNVFHTGYTIWHSHRCCMRVRCSTSSLTYVFLITVPQVGVKCYLYQCIFILFSLIMLLRSWTRSFLVDYPASFRRAHLQQFLLNLTSLCQVAKVSLMLLW